MADDFKNLLLDQAELEKLVIQFFEANNYELVSFRTEDERYRVEFLRNEGENHALVDLLKKGNGTTTIHYKTGKNPEAGLELAIYLKDSIDPDNQDSVNLLLKNINNDQFQYLKEFLSDFRDDSDQNEFELTEEPSDEIRDKFKIKSIKYNDSLSIIYYKTTNKLHLQGKPLFSYRQVVYILAEDLDLNGLLSIIHKKDFSEHSTKIDYKSIENELRDYLPDAFEKLEQKIIEMLKSCFGVRGLDIELPDYTLMVFPALKALEATIRKLFVKNGMYPQEQKYGIGTWFDKAPDGKFVLKRDIAEQINCSNTEAAMVNCYIFYYRQRHGLFHTADYADSSRIIVDKVTAHSLIEKSLRLINLAYKTVSF
jgi:hypothetical protein